MERALASRGGSYFDPAERLCREILSFRFRAVRTQFSLYSRMP